MSADRRPEAMSEQADNPDEGDATLEEPGEVEVRRVPWDPIRMRQFLTGQITLAQLEGIDKPAQYEMAEMGFKLLQQGKLKDAKKIFEGLIALDPRDAYYHMVLGSIAQRQNDLETAEACYSLSLRFNPYSPSALANRGEVRLELGFVETGLEDLRQAVKEDPSAKEAATQRARALIPIAELKLEGNEETTESSAEAFNEPSMTSDTEPKVIAADDSLVVHAEKTVLDREPTPSEQDTIQPLETPSDKPKKAPPKGPAAKPKEPLPETGSVSGSKPRPRKPGASAKPSSSLKPAAKPARPAASPAGASTGPKRLGPKKR